MGGGGATYNRTTTARAFLSVFAADGYRDVGGGFSFFTGCRLLALKAQSSRTDDVPVDASVFRFEFRAVSNGVHYGGVQQGNRSRHRLDCI